MHLVRYRRNQALLMRVPPSAPDAAAPDTQTVRCIIAGALGEGREWLNEAEAKQVLAAYGIPILPAEIGRAHVCTPVTNAHVVCRLLLEQNTSKPRPSSPATYGHPT